MASQLPLHLRPRRSFLFIRTSPLASLLLVQWGEISSFALSNFFGQYYVNLKLSSL